MLPTTALLILAALGPTPQATKGKPAQDTSAILLAERRSIREAEAKALARIAEGLEGMEAAEVRSWIEPAPPKDGPSRFRPLPEVVANATKPATSPNWRAEALAAREAAASGLFALSGRAAKIGRFSLADDALRAVLDRQPDHKEARRLLGFVPHAGGWATPHAAEKLKAGWVDHPEFGWVEASWVPHLDRGELPGLIQPGRPFEWLPTDRADDLRRDIADGWKIETAHFSIRTNVPLSEAIRFGRRLEAFRDLFNALLADVLGPNSPLAQRHAAPGPARIPTRKHHIWYFASKAEYVHYLKPKHGEGVELELGRYDRPTRPGGLGNSYFFRDPEGALEVDATLYHEASHQLLFESGARHDTEKNAGNFWVFEGLGTYFETVCPLADGTLEVGGLIGPRIRQARIRLLDKGQFVPIEDLTRLDQKAFDDESVIFLHYAESMALAVFFMQAEGTRLREPFLDYVRDAFKGNLRRGRGSSLELRVGIPYALLDRKFLAYLKAGSGLAVEPRAEGR